MLLPARSASLVPGVQSVGTTTCVTSNGGPQKSGIEHAVGPCQFPGCPPAQRQRGSKRSMTRLILRYKELRPAYGIVKFLHLRHFHVAPEKRKMIYVAG